MQVNSGKMTEIGATVVLVTANGVTAVRNIFCCCKFNIMKSKALLSDMLHHYPCFIVSASQIRLMLALESCIILGLLGDEQ